DRGGIVEAASVCVVGPQSQPIAEASIHVHKDTVVIVNAGGEENSGTAQLGIAANHWTREVLGSNRQTRRAWRCGTNGGERRIGISAQNLMVAAGSDVAHSQADVATQALLDF